MNRILFDCERAKEPNTGLFHFCLQLGGALLRHADPARERLIFYLRAKRNLFGPDQEYYYYRGYHKLWIPAARSFDLWHGTYQRSSIIPPPGRTRFVFTIHDLNFLVENQGDAAKIKKRIRHVQKNVNRADHIVCISEFTLAAVRAHLDLGNRPAEVIYNGCNVSEYPAFDNPRYHPAKPFIFSVGTVLPKKNFHVLPALLPGTDQELVIAGILRPNYAETIRAAAAQHGVQDRVRLLGPVSEEEKSWYFRNCEAFAFPSVAEGFGLPVIEAMHYGKPVFLSNQASLPEIGGSEAYYFTDFDPAAMREAYARGMADYQTPGRAEQIRKRAARFSWDRAAQDYLAVYRKCLSR